MSFKPEIIIIHHSLTKDGATVSWNAIRRYHIETLGMKDIGYHAGVELVGESVYEALLGRPWDEAGAHTQGENYHSLGLCFVGNFDLEEPPMAQLIVGARVVALWMRLFSIPLGKIFPHSAFASKTCPGKHFPFSKFLSLVGKEGCHD